jgi:hypothetical protein
MLLGMLAFQRAVIFGREAVPDRKAMEGRTRDSLRRF